MIHLQLSNETDALKTVILGIADDFGGTPTLQDAYDPKSKEHIKNGTFPTERDLVGEMSQFEKVLLKYGVDVLRPESITDYNQIFSRDIGFVIEDKFIRSQMLAPREDEIKGIEKLIERMPPTQVIQAPEEVRVEGGDVMLYDDYIFVGYSKKEDFDRYIVSRTNEAGVEFLRSNFPEQKIFSFELNKSDVDPRKNALHLDCIFQPIGQEQAIIHPDGFKNPSEFEWLKNFFGEDKLIFIDAEEMYQMNANIFSINPTTIVSERKFERLNAELKNRGFTVEEIDYAEVSKMEGLLRCSTLPLYRSNG